METFPIGPSIKSFVTYSNENGDQITISHRKGGIGRPDYLITGPGGFTATRQRLDAATEAAFRELARLQREAEERAQAS